ncbi:MAG TPA: hypothetical protein PKA12_02035 [Saprospiraceae bacterium]|mgnify:CR=1 FL=1|nr:hypothetical protein [Saprospiraceae bacterium]
MQYKAYYILLLIFYFGSFHNYVKGQTDNNWKIWIKTDPCSGRHDWISVAKENPTSYGLNFYELANFLFPNVKCTTFGCSFSDATIVANNLKFADEFFDYCCRDYSVWENSTTKARSVVLGNYSTAGFGWNFIKGDLCCEEAELLSGVAGACSGQGGNQNNGNNGSGDWKVWIKTSPCAGRHDWVSVAKDNPTSFGLNYYEVANTIFPQASCTTFGCNFSDATTVANSLKTSDVFFRYCCRDYSVWENSQTRARTIVVGKLSTGGFGWTLVKSDLCCEEAETLSGISNACSGRDKINCWPNSYGAWNPQTQRMECFCNPGTIWDATQNACVPTPVDCSGYANSETRWDPASNQYLCYCKQGFEWNTTRTACIPQNTIPDCNAYYKNSYAAWDNASNQYLCYCNIGYVWNAARTECIPSGGQQDEPVVNPQQKKNGECNIQYKSGANEAEQYTIDVKRNFGSLNFAYETYSVKDRIHIYHGGIKVFDSGCVGANGSQTLNLNGASSIFTIIVDPKCDQDQSDTSWNFTLGCPN